MKRCKGRFTIVFCSVTEVQSRNFKVLCHVWKWSARKYVWRDGFGASELQDLVARDLVSPKVQVKGEKTSLMRIIDKAIAEMRVICRNRCSSLPECRKWVTRSEKLRPCMRNEAGFVLAATGILPRWLSLAVHALQIRCTPYWSPSHPTGGPAGLPHFACAWLAF